MLPIDGLACLVAPELALQELTLLRDYEIGAGWYESGALDLPYGIETTIVSFNVPQTSALLRSVWADQWAGSPTGELFIRCNGTLVPPYDREFIHDVSPNAAILPMFAILTAPSTCVISFRSTTDTLATRPGQFAFMGVRLTPRAARRTLEAP